MTVCIVAPKLLKTFIRELPYSNLARFCRFYYIYFPVLEHNSTFGFTGHLHGGFGK